jgi:hypothetical protein
LIHLSRHRPSPWQSSQETEDERVDPVAHRLIDAPEEAWAAASGSNTCLGMGFSNLISLFIITTAATLNALGITGHSDLGPGGEGAATYCRGVQLCRFRGRHHRHRTPRRAVLVGSAAYALGEGLGGTTGLGRQPIDAKVFYCTIAVATLIGMLINFVGIDPIKMLFWAAAVNGVVAVPLMVVIMIMATQKRVMGRSLCHGRSGRWAGCPRQ